VGRGPQSRRAGGVGDVRLGTYAGLFAEYDAQNRTSAEDAIWAAPAKVRPQSVLKLEPPSKNPEPTRGLEPRTPSLRVALSFVILACQSHIFDHQEFADHVRFAEFGTRPTLSPGEPDDAITRAGL
jgi:hypothetical protein